MPDEAKLPTRPPRRNTETAPFWDACAERRLRLPRCTACTELVWYPRRTCPFCGGRSMEWVDLGGRGTVYSYTVIRRGSGPYRDVGPYVLAIVELTEGPRLMTNILTDDVESVRVGMPVRVRFEPAGESDAIPRFEPA